MKTYKIAVYGTLKNGSRRIEHIKGIMKLASWYPSVRLDKDAYIIEVEIAEIEEKELNEWDTYEDMSTGLYRRTETVTEEGTTVMVYEGAASFKESDETVLPDNDGVVRWKEIMHKDISKF